MSTRVSLADRRQSLVDPNYKGEDYNIDTAIEKGPLGNRRCTDMLCVLVFLIVTTGMGYIGNYAVTYGDPDLIMAPYDSTGNFCGRSPGYENYPYLWYQNLDSTVWIAYSVCVSECPTMANTEADCKLSENSLVTSCVPQPEPYDSKLFLDRWCFPQYSTLPPSIQSNYNNIIGSFGLDDVEMYARDIRLSWKVYLMGIVTCFVLIFFWNLMLRQFAEILAWISILIVGIGIVTLGFLIKYYADANYPEGDSTQKWLNYASYVVWSLAGIYALIVLCSFYAIKISIKVLRVSAKVIMNNMRMIIIPLVGIVVMIVWILFYSYSLLWLMSCGDMKQNQLMGPGNTVLGTYVSYQWTETEKYFIWSTVFYFFWISAFLVAAAQYVLIVAVCSWYFTEDAKSRGDFSILRGYHWLWRYNVGSILFGSFLIAVVCMIRLVFEYIERKMKSVNAQNGVAPVQYLMTCVRCCLDCCHRFVKYINENAYCQVVLTGENFCTAAINGFLLIMKHSATFFFTRGIGSIFNLLGKLTVAVVNCILAYLMIYYLPQLDIKVNSPVGPLIIVFLLSYSIAYLFMSMYTTTSTAMLHSLYADIDICKQLNYDEMTGMNRPKEMSSIVEFLSQSKI